MTKPPGKATADINAANAAFWKKQALQQESLAAESLVDAEPVAGGPAIEFEAARILQLLGGARYACRHADKRRFPDVLKDAARFADSAEVAAMEARRLASYADSLAAAWTYLVTAGILAGTAAGLAASFRGRASGNGRRKDSRPAERRRAMSGLVSTPRVSKQIVCELADQYGGTPGTVKRALSAQRAKTRK